MIILNGRRSRLDLSSCYVVLKIFSYFKSAGAFGKIVKACVGFWMKIDGKTNVVGWFLFYNKISIQNVQYITPTHLKIIKIHRELLNLIIIIIIYNKQNRFLQHFNILHISKRTYYALLSCTKNLLPLEAYIIQT